ncbi:MFS family permease [Frankia sp. AiPs1]|uniref:MFS transporter n=1 Tax=Frankia sp. AiPa1 TaxID=573492 RepID=UPI00202B8117|nr:MFS transporter [Frankia sp. AiPa1]MCL9759859.1 MFS transporter [Frankia sp. AiPa1]
MTAVLASPRTDRRQLAGVLTALATAQLIFSLDINIVFVALPDIGRSLDLSAGSLQWVVGAYAVFAGGFLLLGGRAADLLGRRRMFLAALGLYGVGSLAGSLAPNPAMIIVARAVQGVGGALLLPSTLALLTTSFDEGAARNRALAVWGGAGASGLTLGALSGGVLTQLFGWRAVFVVNVPLVAAVIALAVRVIPPDGDRERGRRFDAAGALTGTAAALLLVYALVQGPIGGWTDPAVGAALGCAAALFGCFMVLERRGSDPLLPATLLTNRSTGIAAAITFAYMATFGVLPYFLTVLFQDTHGLSPLRTGLVFLIPSASIAAGTQAGEHLVTRIGARAALLIGFAVGIPGTALLAVAFEHQAGILVAVPGLIVSGFGQGVVWTGMWIAAGMGVAADQQGVANGLASTTLSLGNAIGLAALTAVAAGHGAPTAVLVATVAMLLGTVLAGALPAHRPA